MRRLQFSVKHLFIAITIAAVILLWYRDHVRIERLELQVFKGRTPTQMRAIPAGMRLVTIRVAAPPARGVRQGDRVNLQLGTTPLVEDVAVWGIQRASVATKPDEFTVLVSPEQAVMMTLAGNRPMKLEKRVTDTSK